MYSKAVWLHSRTGEWWPVSTHDKWIIKPENQERAGLPDYIRDAINSTPETDPDYTDTVRILGCKGGLIRIRAYKNTVSVQFYVSPNKVRNYLWTIYEYFADDPHEQLDIGNLYNSDFVRITVSQLGEKLKNDETIMFESIAEPKNIPLDIPLDAPLKSLLERIDKRLNH